MKAFWLSAALATVPAYAAENVAFEWFEYAGRDTTYNAPLPEGEFHNPILAGYYPDPSVTRVGDKFYLVNSTFAHWPGIPTGWSASPSRRVSPPSRIPTRATCSSRSAATSIRRFAVTR